MIEQSSTEAEFMGNLDFGKILLYICSVLWDLGVPQHAASVLYEDNDACTAMAMAQKPASRTRHMDIKYHVIRDWVERDLIHLRRIDTTANLADLFTKPLGSTLFYRHTDYVLGHVRPFYAPQYTMSSQVSSCISTPPSNVFLTLTRLWTRIASNPLSHQKPPY